MKSRLQLNTIEASRRTLTRLIRGYFRDEMETDKFRTLIYGMDKLLSYWKLEKDIEIEKRLADIENMLCEKEKMC